MDSMNLYESRIQDGTQLDMSGSGFAVKIPSLQKMASYRIAIEVWCNYIKHSKKKSAREPHYLQKLSTVEQNDCDKLIESLGIPWFMKEELKKRVKKVRQETIDCKFHFENQTRPLVYTSCPPDHVLLEKLFEEYKISLDWNCLVWFPNGRIDYKNTAIKLVSSSTLNEAQKFIIMSSYCLENQIKNINLNELPSESFIDKLSFQDTPLQFYWICYLRNDSTHRIINIPLETSHSSVDSVMAAKYDHEFFFEGVQYFWDRLNAEDQVSFISSRLNSNGRNGRKYTYQERRLLFKMSHHQLINLIFRQPVDAILTFLKAMNAPRYALWAWQLTKNGISNEQFHEIVRQSLLHNVYTIRHNEEKMSAFLVIWDATNDHHKHLAIQNSTLGRLVIREILQSKMKLAPSALKFLVKLLSLHSTNFRREIVLESNTRFALRYDFDVVNEIFDLCLPNPDDKVRFLKKANDLHKSLFLGEILYSEDDYNELNRRLLSSLQNLNLASKSDFLNEFVESRITVNKFKGANILYSSACRSDWDRLGKFIETIFQQNASLVSDMKQSYISSFAYNSNPYERYGSFNELVNLVEIEFVNERLRDLKLAFPNVFQKTLSHLCSDGYILRSTTFKIILSWCFENDEEMFSHFKRTVPAEDIFNSIFSGIILQRNPYMTPSILTQIDMFLKWYFSGRTAEIIKFKSSRKNDPKFKEILEGFLRCSSLQRWLDDVENQNLSSSERYGNDSQLFHEVVFPDSSVHEHLPNKKISTLFKFKKIKQWFKRTSNS